uniref:Mini-chromosome maintenance complex-binding protein n=1 Tax=Kwoniella dejecticola CBS 10117 TaxID=1296121 RepID=A0A1A5ZZG1_9TREE|nr:uncharacterized protein I303_06752 [Kwoniella dejecticola CBS 10117]OBR83193.1 hypothetical protein I303_06752 [Kwoniella dejecticola CBS 10117]
MLDTREIIKIAHKEHEHQAGSHADLARFVSDVESQIKDPAVIRHLSASSEPLEVVSFRCLLQDTGYPMEVYLPGEQAEGEVDFSQLKERWVGWGVQVPGEQPWIDEQSREGQDSLPPSVHAKFPLPDRKGNYTGALIKVYDDVTFKPASTHQFVGILSSAPLPTHEPESAELVPTLHVLKIVKIVEDTIEEDEGDAREELVEYLASAFSPPDRLAGEFLLLSLISSPTTRPTAMSPLGTLSVNFRRKDEKVTANFSEIVKSVAPRVVDLPLSIELLHSHPFSPSSTDSSSLDAGLLQLSEGTVLVVEEDAMGGGGQLNEKAVKNLKALAECMTEQRVRYEYPYMEGLKMDCAIRVVVLSQGKTLLPVDVDLVVKGTAGQTFTRPDSLTRLRKYLAHLSSGRHAAKLNIPDDIAEIIQDSFVEGRRENAETAEDALKRRMKVARLLALSYPAAKLTKEVWDRTLYLDREMTGRKL